MKKNVVFITGNEGKRREVEAILGPNKYCIINVDLDVPEIQSISVEDENNFSHIKYDGTLFEYSDLNFINENYRRVFSNQCHEIYKTSLYNRDLEVVKIIEHCF